MSVTTQQHADVASAAAGGAFLSRVKRLRLGEHARLPDGGAVQRKSTTDGREVFQPGDPIDGSGDMTFYGGAHRAPEPAVREALRRSAARSDPASLGGSDRFDRWTDLKLGGRAVRLSHVDTHGRPHVRPAMGPSRDTQPTSFDALSLARPAYRLSESAETAALSVTPKPFGKPGGPGLWKRKGWQLPPYVQQVAHGIQRSGKSESNAIQIAIGKLKDWAAGGGGVSAAVKAAAAKAIAQWEALKGKAHAVKEGEEFTLDDARVLAEFADEHRVLLALVSESDSPEAEEMAVVYEAISEAFEEAKHPRGPGGKWAHVASKVQQLSGSREHGGKVLVAHGSGRTEVKPPGTKVPEADTSRVAVQIPTGKMTSAGRDRLHAHLTGRGQQVGGISGAGKGAKRAPAKGSNLSPDTQKSIAGLVDSAMNQGMSHRRAVEHVSVRQGLSTTKVRAFHRTHGDAGVSGKA